MDDDHYQNVRDYALRLLSFRPRSIKEISAKLQKYCQRRNFPDALMERVIEALVEQKFLGDIEFARWWKERRQSFKPKGLKAIKIELLQKGVGKEAVDSVINEGGKEGINEYDLAMKFLEKKTLYLKNLPPLKLKIKLRDMLFRRGFDWETIAKVIDSFGKKE